MRALPVISLIMVGMAVMQSPPSGSHYRGVAVQAARWVRAQPVSESSSLYSGTPGPILFHLEMARSTGDADALATARRGADALAASIAGPAPILANGLYDGVAGIGFTLGQSYLVTGDQKYKAAALECVKRLQASARAVGRGVEWNDTTDIISGGAGIGLFLLWADAELQAPGSHDLAERAGRRLIELSIEPQPGQRKWMMSPSYPRELPNFSHGTAGVAYFLATLGQRTQQQAFLDAAVAGGRYLIAVADQDGDICLIRHNDAPADRRLYYLSWCHGPAGTARTFYRLFQATNDESWLAWTKKSARALVASGAPERVVTPGEWDNVGVCCGITGQAQFFLDMHDVTREAQYLALARKASDLLVARATRDDRGARWVQAETRVKPEIREAQTGLMQGASGVGMWLLHFADAIDGRRGPVITLPDNPFRY